MKRLMSAFIVSRTYCCSAVLACFLSSSLASLLRILRATMRQVTGLDPRKDGGNTLAANRVHDQVQTICHTSRFDRFVKRLNSFQVLAMRCFFFLTLLSFLLFVYKSFLEGLV